MVKMVSLSEEAYRILKHQKKPGMSFSDVIKDRFREGITDRVDEIPDLIEWINKQDIPKGKKQHISDRVDEIVYGIKRS